MSDFFLFNAQLTNQQTCKHPVYYGSILLDDSLVTGKISLSLAHLQSSNQQMSV